MQDSIPRLCSVYPINCPNTDQQFQGIVLQKVGNINSYLTRWLLWNNKEVHSPEKHKENGLSNMLEQYFNIQKQ